MYGGWVIKIWLLTTIEGKLTRITRHILMTKVRRITIMPFASSQRLSTKLPLTQDPSYRTTSRIGLSVPDCGCMAGTQPKTIPTDRLLNGGCLMVNLFTLLARALKYLPQWLRTRPSTISPRKIFSYMTSVALQLSFGRKRPNFWRKTTAVSV